MNTSGVGHIVGQSMVVAVRSRAARVFKAREFECTVSSSAPSATAAESPASTVVDINGDLRSTGVRPRSKPCVNLTSRDPVGRSTSRLSREGKKLAISPPAPGESSADAKAPGHKMRCSRCGRTAVPVVAQCRRSTPKAQSPVPVAWRRARGRPVILPIRRPGSKKNCRGSRHGKSDVCPISMANKRRNCQMPSGSVQDEQ